MSFTFTEREAVRARIWAEIALLMYEFPEREVATVLREEADRILGKKSARPRVSLDERQDEVVAEYLAQVESGEISVRDAVWRSFSRGAVFGATSKPNR